MSLAEGKRQMSFQEGGPVIAQNPNPHAMSLFIPANLTFGGDQTINLEAFINWVQAILLM